ncbi:MAG: hypothetical protein ACYCZF_13670 [Anaerolineae bacterium]
MVKLTRNRLQIADDRRLIAHYYYEEGLTQADIAKLLNERDYVDYTLSQQVVSYDLKQVEKNWIQTSREYRAGLKAEQHKKIDNLEAVYWAAWERSLTKRQRQSVATKTVNGVKTRVKTVITSDEPDGDPRFLEGVQWCIEMRCELEGLYQKISYTPTDLPGKSYPTPAIYEQVGDSKPVRVYWGSEKK